MRALSLVGTTARPLGGRGPARARPLVARATGAPVVDSHVHVWAPLEPRAPEFPYATNADGSEDVPPVEGHG